MAERESTGLQPRVEGFDSLSVLQLIGRTREAIRDSRKRRRPKLPPLEDLRIYKRMLPREVRDRVNRGSSFMRHKDYLDDRGFDLPGMDDGPHYLVIPEGKIAEVWDYRHARDPQWMKWDLA